MYLKSMDLGGFNLVTVLLGAIIFWDLLSQSQRAVSTAFLEEVWERNLLNIFVTPLTVIEFLTSMLLVGVVRVVLVGIVTGVLAFFLYALNLLQFGFLLIPFIINLLIFGWMAGLFSTGIILRYGTSAQVLAFGLMFLVQPFSAVFYPVSALPESIQFISYLIPSTYVFEGVRAVITTGSIPYAYLAQAFVANIIYLGLVMWFFYTMFARVKEKGLLLKLD